MRNRAAPLGLVALCAGCWFRLGDGTGSVVLTWSLNGGEDCTTVGVTEVDVSVGSLSLAIACDDLGGGNIAGTVLPHIPPGTQTFTVTAIGPVYDSDAGFTHSQAAFRSTFAFDVAEESTNITPVVDLLPVDTSGGDGGTGGDLVLLWSFGGQTCAQAEVSQVTILLDDASAGGDELTVPCHSSGRDGTRILGLAQSLYSFPLSAHGPADFPASAYVAAPTAYSTGFTETTEHVDLHSILHESLPGEAISLEVIFGFGPDGGGCAQSGASQTRVQLFQSQLSGAGASMGGQPPPLAYRTMLVLDQLLLCQGDPGPTLMKSTADRTPGEALPCDPEEIDSGTCPIVAGEYTLTAQGLDVGGSVLFEINNYDLSVDQGVSNGVPAGMVPEYGQSEGTGSIPGLVDSTYLVNLPAMPASQ
jgi:hypothetical protein